MNREEQVLAVMQKLKDPATIRSQAQRLLALAKSDRLRHYRLCEERLEPVADYVIEVILDQYPDLNIPPHSRWNHFNVQNSNRINSMNLAQYEAEERGRIGTELVIISVLLDAGAGPVWSYYEPASGKRYDRSEGLAVASLDLYKSGGFSHSGNQPLRVDAQTLKTLTEAQVREAFQITVDNPMIGIAGRVGLLHQLGEVIDSLPQVFGEEGRLGNIFSYLKPQAVGGKLSIKVLFDFIMDSLLQIWPHRVTFEGHPLGDIWKHSALQNGDLGSEYIPFHKLSQWMIYSLVQPFALAGIELTDLDSLTGLPEYRNGGLFIDMGVLQSKIGDVSQIPLLPESELVVEWRGLTVALLDELAAIIRKKLNKSEAELPMAKILEGGTWEAGRRIAKTLRPLGRPPLQIISDGTVF